MVEHEDCLLGNRASESALVPLQFEQKWRALYRLEDSIGNIQDRGIQIWAIGVDADEGSGVERRQGGKESKLQIRATRDRALTGPQQP